MAWCGLLCCPMMMRTYCPGGVLEWVQWASSLRHHRRGAACGGHKRAAVCVDIIDIADIFIQLPVHTEASTPAMWPPSLA